MSVLGYLADLASLQPLGTADKQQALSDQSDAALRALNASDPNTAGNQALLDQHINQGNADSGAGDVAGSILSDFASGAQQGPGSWLKTVLNWIGGLLGGVFKAIPWWLWLALLATIFYWLGGFSWLAKKTRGLIK